MELAKKGAAAIGASLALTAVLASVAFAVPQDPAIQDLGEGACYDVVEIDVSQVDLDATLDGAPEAAGEIADAPCSPADEALDQEGALTMAAFEVVDVDISTMDLETWLDGTPEVDDAEA